jgi:TonB family protein
MPSYPGGKSVVARVSLEIDEEGSVVMAKPRGPQPHPDFYEAVVQAARSWKVSPPRAKGVPVKTEINLDFKYN